MPDLQLHLARFLFQYRITPHQQLEFRLWRYSWVDVHAHIWHPTTTSRVRASQVRQKAGHDRRASKVRSFQLDEAVYATNSASGPKWLSGVTTAIRGPLSYEVTLSDHRVIRRHVNHLKSRSMDSGSDDDWLLDPVDVSTDTTVTRSMLL